MYPQIAINAIAFLKRTDLKGAEAAPMMEVMQFLSTIAEGALTVSRPAPKPETKE